MAGLGIGVAFVGYWCLYYGVTQIQGMNYGFLDLGLPAKWAAAHKTPPANDTGSPPPAASAAGVAATVTKAVAGAGASAAASGATAAKKQANPITGPLELTSAALKALSKYLGG